MTTNDTGKAIYEDGTPKFVKKFTDLRAWKENHQFVVEIYKMVKVLPQEEQFGLANQIRRAAVSVTSNIAEGFGRDSFQEKLRFYYIARGSLTEVQSQLMIAKDVGYIEGNTFEQLINQSTECHKVLTGLIKKTKEIIKDRIS